MRRRWVLALVAVLLLASCSDGQPSERPASRSASEAGVAYAKYLLERGTTADPALQLCALVAKRRQQAKRYTDQERVSFLLACREMVQANEAGDGRRPRGTPSNSSR
jgi:hypothetical protein